MRKSGGAAARNLSSSSQLARVNRAGIKRSRICRAAGPIRRRRRIAQAQSQARPTTIGVREPTRIARLDSTATTSTEAKPKPRSSATTAARSAARLAEFSATSRHEFQGASEIESSSTPSTIDSPSRFSSPSMKLTVTGRSTRLLLGSANLRLYLWQVHGLLAGNFQPDRSGWTILAIVVLVGAASAIAFLMLMFGDAGEDDRRFLRTAWWMLAGWLILLGGAAVYVSFLAF